MCVCLRACMHVCVHVCVCASVAQLVENLPSKQYAWVRIPPEQLFFHWKKRCSGLYCLALIYVRRSNCFHVNIQLGVGRHWWFTYCRPLFNVE